MEYSVLFKVQLTIRAYCIIIGKPLTMKDPKPKIPHAISQPPRATEPLAPRFAE